MKTKLSIFFLFLFLTATIAQQQKDSLSKNTGGFYFGVGLISKQNLNLNQKLESSNFAAIPEILPEIIIGINFIGKKYSGDFEFATAAIEKTNMGNKRQYVTASVRGNFSYNLVNKEKIAFTTGVNLVLARSELDLFQENAVVDLNNINTVGSMGRITLNNGMLYAGPSASLYLFKNTNWQVRARAAYEFGLSSGEWRSDFAAVNNTVGRHGNNRFLFSILFF